MYAARKLYTAFLAEVSIQEQEETLAKIKSHQKVPRRNATYILKSTQPLTSDSSQFCRHRASEYLASSKNLMVSKNPGED